MLRLPASSSTATIEQLIAVDPAIIRGYARGVADELGRGPLTLDRRDRLLGRAKHLGMGRFEAALVLAVIERQQPVAIEPATRSDRSTSQRSTSWRSTSRWTMLTVACTLQLSIVAAAWWLVQ